MKTNFIKWGAFFGAVAVGLGAFGAHGLKNFLEPNKLAIFETAVRYQFFHALALLLFAALIEQVNPKWRSWIGRMFVIGILFFSGSLYLLSCGEVLGIPSSMRKIIGPITPIGGLCFILGWIGLFLFTNQSASTNSK